MLGNRAAIGFRAGYFHVKLTEEEQGSTLQEITENSLQKKCIYIKKLQVTIIRT